MAEIVETTIRCAYADAPCIGALGVRGADRAVAAETCANNGRVVEGVAQLCQGLSIIAEANVGLGGAK